MEGAPGLVGVMEYGVGHLQCVKVSECIMVVNDHDYSVYYASVRMRKRGIRQCVCVSV